MDLRHARTFVTVAELGTVSKAAQRLHIAQPALSRQIGEFEQELGVALFDRVGRRLVLTSAGEQLLDDCRALLSSAAALKEHASQLQGGDQGVLKVAASPQIIEGAIAGFLQGYAQTFPKVQVKLVEAMGWTDVVAMFERGDIHLGLNLVGAVQPDDARFANHRLEPIDLLAAFHPNRALGSNGKVEIEQLALEPLLLLDASYVFRRKFDGACRLAGVQPEVAYESRTPHTLLAMAESGHGVAIIPSGLRTDRHRLRIAALAYRGKPLREHLTMYWDRRRTLPRHATAFCDMLAAHMREVFPISRPSRTIGSKRR
jgi:DNA-binding transcriptional LysR family regulator